MLIAQICHGSIGGSSRMACRLANALSRRGHIVHVFSRTNLPWPLETPVVQHASEPVRQDWTAPLYWEWTDPEKASFATMLEAQLRAHQFDILHYHYALPFAGIMRKVASALGGDMPFVVGTLHGTDLTSCLGNPMAASSMSRDLLATDRVTTVSQHMYRTAGALRGIGPLQILPNFVEDESTEPSTPEAPPAQMDRPVILHVSNFRVVKDVGLLVRLFLAIHERTGAELRLVGDGPEMQSVRTQLDMSPASAAIHYHGATPTPERHFREATLYLSTSVEESFGLAVLEAMANGIPVAATAVGGIPELIEDEITGLLFHASDFEGAVDRIVALLGSAARLEAISRACLERAAAMRESRVISRYEHLYRTNTPTRRYVS